MTCNNYATLVARNIVLVQPYVFKKKGGGLYGKEMRH